MNPAPDAPLRRDTVPLELNDFPDWLSPMLVKELRQGLRTRAFLFTLIALHVIMVLLLANGLAQSVDAHDTHGIGTLFWGVIYLLLLAGTSLRAINELHAERSARTLELLNAAGVSGTRIAFGKWIALMTQGVLMTVSVAPYFVMRYYLGSVDLLLDIKILCTALMGAAICTALGMAASVGNLLFRGAAAMALSVGTLFFWGAMTALRDNPDTLSAFNLMSTEWVLLGGLTLLAVTVLLRLAGDAIDTPAHNGAALPRILLALGWAPAFLPRFKELAALYQGVHLFWMTLLTGITFFWHLRGGLLFRAVQLRAFRPFGVAARPLALLLSPTWVGTLWVVPLGVSAFVTAQPDKSVQPGLWLVGANLLSAVWVWRLFFKNSDDPKGWFLLYWAMGGLCAALARALGAHWELPWLSLAPTVGIWQYLGSVPKDREALEWVSAARASCLLHLLVCMLPALFWVRASTAWKQAFASPKTD